MRSYTYLTFFRDLHFCFGAVKRESRIDSINLRMFVNVPHSQSGAVPMSSLSGVGQLGLWEVGEGGMIGLKGGANRVSLQAT